jgi:hypothetical protein
MVTMPAESRSSLHVVLHVVDICMDESTKRFDYV